MTFSIRPSGFFHDIQAQQPVLLPMPSSLGHVLEIKHLSMRYPSSANWILDGLSLTISAGERLALVGPSGCGKSTVAKVALQLLPAGSICKGSLLLAGNDPRTLSHARLRAFRGEAVGLIFQDPMTRLNPLMTIGGHLLDTLRAHRPDKSFTWRRKRAEELLEKVGINSSRFGAYPHEFSGGMRQRVAIALAIALNPPLVIADEPTTSLDTAVADLVMAELKRLCEDLGSALLLISHDLALAARWCERMAVLEKGQIVEMGSSKNLLLKPQSGIGKRLVTSAREREGVFLSPISESSVVLEVNRLRCWHSLGGWPWKFAWVKAVDEVSFCLFKGESLGLVGSSGCGKTTLCRALMGLTPSRGGEVKLEGQNFLNLSGESLRQARRGIQMVFQDPLACFNPKMTVGEAISDPLLIHKAVSRLEARQRARELLNQVGLDPPEVFQNRYPRELSGGQQQRVAIARALALCPKVLLFDESVSMLDAEIQAEILALLKSLQKRLGLAIVFITHDLSVATGFCNRVLVLEKGQIVEEGSGQQLLNAPKEMITRKLVDACPRLPSLD